jgi:hypothetical protein
MNMNVDTKKIGFNIATAFSHMTDLQVGFTVGRDADVQAALELRNQQRVAEYKAKLMAELLK